MLLLPIRLEFCRAFENLSNKYQFLSIGFHVKIKSVGLAKPMPNFIINLSFRYFIYRFRNQHDFCFVRTGSELKLINSCQGVELFILLLAFENLSRFNARPRARGLIKSFRIDVFPRRLFTRNVDVYNRLSGLIYRNERNTEIHPVIPSLP